MSHLKVLLVTQNAEVRQVAEGALMEPGETVLPASDLAGALALCVEHAPDLAVIDAAMPGGSALALVHHVLASSTKTAIFVLAPAANFDVAAEALALGASGIIVAPVTGDAVLRAVADVRGRVLAEERVVKLASEVRDAAELVDVMTQALVVARAGDPRALGETLLTLFLIASGSRGVAIYGEESNEDGTRPRIAAYGTSLELLDRYNDLELAQLATGRQGEVIGLASGSHMFGCVLLERPDPMRTARVHRVIEFVTALLPLSVLARSAIAEEPTAPRSRALPVEVFERLVQRDTDAARPSGADLVVLCAVARGAEPIELGMLGAALAQPGAALGMGHGGEAYVLLPRTTLSAARAMLVEIALPCGVVSAPADGRNAEVLMRIARERARRAAQNGPLSRTLRDKPLAEALAAVVSPAEGSALVPLEVRAEAVESMVLHACRRARACGDARCVVGHVGDGARIVATVRDAVGPAGAVRGVRLPDETGPGSLVVLLETKRASWGLVVRVQEGRVRVAHTADPLSLQILGSMLVEVT